MKLSDLDDEYAPAHAARQQARQAQQRRIAQQRQTANAAPIDDTSELSAAVAKLAGAWGLTKRQRKVTK